MSEIGYVYILKNEAMPGIYKIGVTSREDLDKRVRELYTTSIPFPFECEFSCKVEDYKKVEKILHNAFHDYRMNPNREFFNVSPERVIPMLEHLKIEETTTIFNEQINLNVDSVDKEAVKQYASRRPRFNFHEMGIENGETLTFYDENKLLEVEVVSEKLVRYNDENRSLSKLTAEILGYSSNVGPMRYWKYKGKSLREVYDETYGGAE